MKRPFIYLTAIALALLLQYSCKKDNTKDPVVTPETLNTASSAGTAISAAQQSFMMSSIIVAADSGYNVNFPTDGKKSKLIKNLQSAYNYEWIGPDANGWYTRSWNAMYDYEEKVKFGDTIIHIISYSFYQRQ